MKDVIYFKVSKELGTDLLAKKVRSEYIIRKEQLLLKSKRAINPIVTLYDQDGDSFIKNELTVVIKYQAFKIPRIVKQLLNKKKWKRVVCKEDNVLIIDNSPFELPKIMN